MASRIPGFALDKDLDVEQVESALNVIGVDASALERALESDEQRDRLIALLEAHLEAQRRYERRRRILLEHRRAVADAKLLDTLLGGVENRDEASEGPTSDVDELRRVERARPLERFAKVKAERTPEPA